MSVSRAAYLRSLATAPGQGGENFIFDMRQPINVYELARRVSLFSRLVPGEELPMQIVSLCEGEEIHDGLCEDGSGRELPITHGFL